MSNIIIDQPALGRTSRAARTTPFELAEFRSERLKARIRRRRRYLALVAMLALAGVAALANSLMQHSAGTSDFASSEPLLFHTVRRTDLAINVTERGTLASQRETRITCELETVPGQSGSRILSLVPNGTAVKQGDLLVEFDAAPLRDRLNTQMVVYEQAKAARIQAAVRYENQLTQNETNLATAKLRVATAEMALKMYEDQSGGAYKISLADLDAKIQESKYQIAEALAALKMKSGRRQGIEVLFKMGYRGKGDLDQAVHEHLQADFALVKSSNALAAALANKKKLESYEYPLKQLELNGAIETARRALTQVERDNEAILAQVQATKAAAERAALTEEEKLKKYQEQLEKCKVHAPHDGLVAHSPDRTPWGRLVADGELVTERFKILSLPDLAHMQVKTSVHESVLDQVKTGLAATIRLDAFPDASYQGTVRSVAVLPAQDSSMSADVKVYDVIVTIDQEVEHLKPGMTAVVDIHVKRLSDVLVIPVQSVVQEEDQTFCYVQAGKGLERRNLKLGLASQSLVEVLEGLQVDERVVLNPMSIAHELPAASTPSAAAGGPPLAAAQPATGR